MTFAVRVEPENGKFAATFCGLPELRSVAATADEAVESLKSEVRRRLLSGELRLLEIASGITSFAGTHRADPYLDEIIEEIYRRRDAETCQ